MKKIAIAISSLLLSAHLYAFDSFVISDIRVDGLQRITEGTIFNYFPLDKGDQVTASNARAGIRELYKTGFFSDINLKREGDILVVEVKERPAIESIALTGNKAIKSEDLLQGLSEIGLAEGEVFDQLQLDRVQQELTRQYYSQGRYGVQVNASVNDLERNRVRVSIQIDEGDTAKIRHINIVGNTLFTDEEILETFEADTPKWWKFWSKDPQYSKEKLSGDMEKLRSYYQDRGYVDFNVESTQVSISPDKQDIYITANVREGEIFDISEINITGDLVVEEGTLRRLIFTKPETVFSRKSMEQSVENITALLSNIGYAFANVSPIPDIDRENRKVAITYFVEPGKRVYVRRVVFNGNSSTKDEVLRREMRQFEGAWFSQAAIDRSKVRLQRLTYFEEVNIETPPVTGTDDQVDIIVTVEERPAGSFQFGLGYSQLQDLILSASLQQDNFLGSGKRIGVSTSYSSILKQINLSFNNPYWTDDGVARGYYLRYRDFDQSGANISTFTSKEIAGGVNFGMPLTEIDFVRFGLGIRRTDILAGVVVSSGFPGAETFQFDDEGNLVLDDDGNPICLDANMNGICPEFARVPQTFDPLATSLDFNGDGVLSDKEREYNTYQVDLGWTRDSRNHFLNPTKGSIQQLALEASIPGSTREYYKLSYRYAKYFPIWRDFVFSIRGDLGYGDAYDSYDEQSLAEPITTLPPDQIITDPDTGEDIVVPGISDCGAGRFVATEDISRLDRGLPFFEHFYAGGVRDIRGFRDNTLGPIDGACRSIGGDFKVSGGFELAFPTPLLGGRGGSRLALFFDVGNVYEDYDAFDANKLRASTGLSMTWQAPIGPVIINYAIPIRKEDGDRTETLQFSFGTTF